ncbi:MAG: ATP-binding protein [Ilumatobacteraceae bacterium]
MNLSAVDREHQIFDAVTASALAARRFVGEILHQRSAPNSVVVDFRLVASELVSNVIEHGDGRGLTVFVDFSDHHWWEICVVSGTTPSSSKMQQPNEWTIAGDEDKTGRGLGIVRHLMDEVITTVSEGLVSIRCRRRRTET